MVAARHRPMTRDHERPPRGFSDGALSTAGLAQIARCGSGPMVGCCARSSSCSVSRAFGRAQRCLRQPHGRRAYGAPELDSAVVEGPDYRLRDSSRPFLMFAMRMNIRSANIEAHEGSTRNGTIQPPVHGLSLRGAIVTIEPAGDSRVVLRVAPGAPVERPPANRNEGRLWPWRRVDVGEEFQVAPSVSAACPCHAATMAQHCRGGRRRATPNHQPRRACLTCGGRPLQEAPTQGPKPSRSAKIPPTGGEGPPLLATQM
jgi:hypothetical protein